MPKTFTHEQLKELETIYGLKPVAETLPVRDGVVAKGDMVWWRYTAGPVHVVSDSEDHWPNIKNHPSAYQLAEPRTKITYVD